MKNEKANHLARFLLFWLAMAGVPAFAAGQGSIGMGGEARAEFSASGYLKSFFTLLQPTDLEGVSEDQPAVGIAANNFRIKLNWQPAPGVSLTAAYELVPQIQPADLSQLFPRPQGSIGAYRFADLDNRLYPQPGKPASGFELVQNLDRLFAIYSPAFGDVTVGRQPVAFGSAHVINPTDVLAPFTFQTLDKEERAGVDALRLKIPVGSLGEFDAGCVFGREGEPDRSAGFLKQRINFWDTDITGLVMDFRKNLLLGLDLNRSLGGASVWLETAYVLAGAFDERKTSENYLRLSAGADYNLTESLYGLLEYHYNGAGSAEPGAYTALFQQTAYHEGSVYLLGRQYLVPGLSWQISPLLTFSGEALWNLNDASFFISPALDYSFADDVTLEAGAFIPAGRKSERADSGPSAKSEFGGYPSIYFASIKVYY